MATPAKSAKPSEAAAPTAKSNTKTILIIVIGAVVVLLGGGLALYLLLTPVHGSKRGSEPAKVEPVAQAVEVQPVYVELGTFTANLMKEDGDRFLQIAITLKITRPALEESIKLRKPEMLHRVNMLLQSKKPSDLATVEGKDTLASELKAHMEYVLGLRKDAPIIGAASGASETAKAGGVRTLHPAPEAPYVHDERGEIADVLFTSFIIQ